MWVIATYESTALFTLKPAMATASGGKTLIVPTPYSIKMALLDCACRLNGQPAGAVSWDWLREIHVAIQPAPEVIVNNTFAKVLKPRREDSGSKETDAGFFQRTIAYREYAYLHGAFGIALGTDVESYASELAYWMSHINYLGRRGGFIQLAAPPQIAGELPTSYLRLDQPSEGFHLKGTILTQLDDTGSELTFERVNIYTSEKITLDKHRILRHVELPYRQVSSSRGYTHYRLTEGDDQP
jgi:hypothetical protein